MVPFVSVLAVICGVQMGPPSIVCSAATTSFSKSSSPYSVQLKAPNINTLCVLNTSRITDKFNPGHEATKSVVSATRSMDRVDVVIRSRGNALEHHSVCNVLNSQWLKMLSALGEAMGKFLR